jgi:O-antigen/teichoic acid export membrane protein
MIATDYKMTSTRVGHANLNHLRGFVLLSGGQALARSMTFIALMYMARTLGVEVFGMIGFAAGLTGYLMMVVDAGLDLIAMREIARSQASAESIVGSVILLRVGFAAVAMTLLSAIAVWLALTPPALMITLAYGLTFFSSAINLKWVFQTLERNGTVAVALALSQFVFLVALLLLVHGAEDGPNIPILIFAAELTGVALLLVQFRKQGLRLRLPASRHISWGLFREALPLAGTQLVRALSMHFDLFLLAMVDKPITVGLYSAVTRVIMLLREFSALYYLPLFPGLSRAAREAAHRFTAMGQAAMRHAAALAFPLVVGGCMTASDLLSFLFGPEYAPGGLALCLLLIASTVGTVAGIYRFALITYDRQGTLFRIIAAGSALNVTLNLILIPRYSIAGAAFSALASETLVFVLGWTSVMRSVSLSPWMPMLRPALATGAMALVLEGIPDSSFPLKVGIAAASYAVFIVLFGAVHLHELTGVWQTKSSVAAGKSNKVDTSNAQS